MSAAIFQPAIPNLTVGGVVFTDLQNLIVLVSRVGFGKYSVFADQNNVAVQGYQVPAGKTLYIRAAALEAVSAYTAGSASMLLGYCDNDIGYNNASSGTNQTTIRYGATAVCLSTASQRRELPIFASVPAQKYATVNSNAAAGDGFIWLYGYVR